MADCRKMMFASRREARRTARRLGKGRAVYRCPRCGHWHVTSRGMGENRNDGNKPPAPDRTGRLSRRLMNEKLERAAERIGL